eukprot:gene24016-9591_t
MISREFFQGRAARPAHASTPKHMRLSIASIPRIAALSKRANAISSACDVSTQASIEASGSPEACRREVLMGGAVALSSALMLQLPMLALAEESDAPTTSAGPYLDPVDKFQITPPKGWVFGQGAIGGALRSEGPFASAGSTRRTLAWFPEGANPRDVNLTVTMTNVSVEFTKLGSFGNVDTFAGNLINSLDRSYLLRKGNWTAAPTEPVQIAKLVDYKGSLDQYSVEYTVQKLPEAKRHLFSVVQLGNNGVYNRLYTATAQCLEDDLPKYKSEMEAALKTFVSNDKPLNG